MKVRLTEFELFQAAIVGCRRNIESLGSTHHQHGKKSLGWEINVEGAAGEIAFAKYMGWYWSGSINTFKTGGDVMDFEVRTRILKKKGEQGYLDEEWMYDMIVRPDDKDESSYVMVLGRAPNYEVIGWLPGRDAKRPEYLKNHGGRPYAHFVPQSVLRPIEELKEYDNI